MAFIMDNLGTLAVAVALVVCVVLAALKIISDKKKGKSSCSGSCANCTMNCESKKMNEK